MEEKHLTDFIGETPLMHILRLDQAGNGNKIFAKLEGNNPAGSVKDRPAWSMIRHAQARGEIKPGDQLIEATSGNTGIALAMAAAAAGYKLKLIMPEHMSAERRAVMRAFGAEIVLVSKATGMEGARDMALKMQADGEGRVLDQFANPDNPLAHYETTGPEIWRETEGKITHFVSSMGTTGTITGTGRFLREQSDTVQIIGVQPTDGSRIPGIRRWSPAFVPKIYDDSVVHRKMDVSEEEAIATMRTLAREAGVFAGMSSGGATAAALRLAEEIDEGLIVCIICDRGDRYLSSGMY